MITNPDGAFMAQVARNLFLRGKKYFVIDRDSKFTEAFRKTLAGAEVETVLTAVRAPNMNAVAERFVKTIKDECLSKMVFFGEGMLRRAIGEFVEHYHAERNHGARQPAAAAGADAAGDRGNRASECPARWAAQLLPTAQAASGELSPARQSREGDRRWFRCGYRATGSRTTCPGGWTRAGNGPRSRHFRPEMRAFEFSDSARHLRPEMHPFQFSDSTGVRGNARISALGQHGLGQHAYKTLTLVSLKAPGRSASIASAISPDTTCQTQGPKSNSNKSKWDTSRRDNTGTLTTRSPTTSSSAPTQTRAAITSQMSTCKIASLLLT